LQVIGLGTDFYPRVIAYQDNAGAWHASGQVLETTYKLSTITVGYGNQGNLQVYGLSDDPTYPSAGVFAGFQDRSSCSWTGGAGLLNVYFRYHDLVQVNGNDGNLQVLGLPISVAPPFSRTSFAPYVATWQDSDGNWSPGPPGPVASNFSPVLASFAAAQGNGGNLQVWGLGTDALPHMVAWQDSSGTWHNVGSLPQYNTSLSDLIMGHGNGGNIEVIGLGTNQHIALISVQDSGGNWSAGEDLTTLVSKGSGGGGGGVGGGGCPRC
jgi:hypothetical protein